MKQDPSTGNRSDKLSEKLMLSSSCLFDDPGPDEAYRISDASLSRDGRYIAYAIEWGEQRHVELRINDHRLAGCEPDAAARFIGLPVSNHPFAYAFDSNGNLVYSRQSGQIWKLFLWNADSGISSEIAGDFEAISDVVCGPRAGEIAFAARSKGKWSAWRFDGAGSDRLMLAGNLDYISRLVFSPDGSRLAYAARRGPSWSIMLDSEKRSLDFDKVGTPSFNGDGTHIAYAGRRGEAWCVFIDDHGVSPELKFNEEIFWVEGEMPLDSIDLAKVKLDSDGTKVCFVYAFWAKGVAGWQFCLMSDRERLGPVFRSLDFVLDGGSVTFAGLVQGKRELLQAMASIE